MIVCVCACMCVLQQGAAVWYVAAMIPHTQTHIHRHAYTCGTHDLQVRLCVCAISGERAPNRIPGRKKERLIYRDGKMHY